MTNSEILNLILLRLKQRTDGEIRTGALLEIKLAIERYSQAEVKPWFLKYILTFSLDPSQNGVVDLTSLEPAYQFLAFDEDSLEEAIVAYPLSLTSADRRRVILRPQSQIYTSEEYPARSYGWPEVAFFEGSKWINLRPWPDETYIVQISGYWAQAVDAFADNSSTSIWAKHASDLLVAEAGYQVASKHIGDQELAATLQAEIPRAWKRLKDESVARKNAGFIFSAGEED